MAVTALPKIKLIASMTEFSSIEKIMEFSNIWGYLGLPAVTWGFLIFLGIVIEFGVIIKILNMEQPKILVAIRKRPLSKKEGARGETDIISVKNSDTVIVS